MTVYIENMSFYTTEEQVYELFSRAGEIKKIIMGLDKNTKTPCGFCFVICYSRQDAEDSVKYISCTILDDRQFVLILIGGSKNADNGDRAAAVVRCMMNIALNMILRWIWEIGPERARGTASASGLWWRIIGFFPTSDPIIIRFEELRTPEIDVSDGRHGGSYRHGRDYDLKRHHDDDHYAPEMSKRSADQDYRRNSDQETRMEKNPRFRESGESDADYRRRRR